MKTNHQVRLAARPVGLPKRSDWSLTEEAVGEPGEGRILVKVDYISLDPAMRGWMNEGKSYIRPVGIGEVMRAGAAGRVVASRHPGFAPGDAVTGGFGVQEYAISDGRGVQKVDTRFVKLPTYLAALGMPGMTAYFGLLDIGKPVAGETVVVSGAAGAVGSLVGQIARILGCRVVGIAGGADKCRMLTGELGFDAAIDYKSEDVKAALRQHCPDGIDVYFDNVGGDILEAALARLALHARIVICGAISQYNNTAPVKGPSNYMSLLVNRASMTGMVVFDYAERYGEAAREIAQWIAQGRLKSREDVVPGGIEAFPEVLLRLFEGANTGKLVLDLHGVGNRDKHTQWRADWENAIVLGIRQWDARVPLEFHFTEFDDLFEKAPLNAATVIEALARLATSGLFYGLFDLFRGPRGISDAIEKVRWTAGMVAQWVALEDLRGKSRARIGKDIESFAPDVIAAHSLGSLLLYDTLRLDESAGGTLSEGKVLLTFGSQIGNPAVRQVFGGRIEELRDTSRWWHLFNPFDDAFTCPLEPATRERFVQVDTPFEIEGFADHEGAHYLGHDETALTVWRALGTDARALAEPAKRATARRVRKTPAAADAPQHRALLVGIADYPKPEDRLGGPVNDVFLVSSVLQEMGFPPESMRVVLNERATCKGIRERFAWLVEGARAGDTLFFYFAGHGTQIAAYGHESEVERIDECLVPYDFDWQAANAITDDEFAGLYGQLPYNVRFFSVLDCCHSGGMARAAGTNVRGLNPPDDIRHRSIRWDAQTQMWLPRRRLAQARERLVKPAEPHKALWIGEHGDKRRLGRASGLWLDDSREFEKARKSYNHRGPYTPIVFEACAEDELAYEYRHGTVNHGAFTFSFCQELRDAVRPPRGAKRKPVRTYAELLSAVRQRIPEVVFEPQTPQLLCPKARLDEALPGLREPVRRK
jgi:NADPH-dependent curcumin reductase CurA